MPLAKSITHASADDIKLMLVPAPAVMVPYGLPLLGLAMMSHMMSYFLAILMKKATPVHAPAKMDHPLTHQMEEDAAEDVDVAEDVVGAEVTVVTEEVTVVVLEDEEVVDVEVTVVNEAVTEDVKNKMFIAEDDRRIQSNTKTATIFQLI